MRSVCASIWRALGHPATLAALMAGLIALVVVERAQAPRGRVRVLAALLAPTRVAFDAGGVARVVPAWEARGVPPPPGPIEVDVHPSPALDREHWLLGWRVASTSKNLFAGFDGTWKTSRDVTDDEWRSIAGALASHYAGTDRSWVGEAVLRPALTRRTHWWNVAGLIGEVLLGALCLASAASLVGWVKRRVSARRRRLGRCGACGYERTGIDGVCPECGAEREAPATTANG